MTDCEVSDGAERLNPALKQSLATEVGLFEVNAGREDARKQVMVSGCPHLAPINLKLLASPLDMSEELFRRCLNELDIIKHAVQVL